MKKDDRAVIMYGYENKDRANINGKERTSFKKLAKEHLDRTSDNIDQLANLQELKEISNPKFRQFTRFQQSSPCTEE